MSIYSEHKPEGSDGLYLKLKDGDKPKLRIASEPVISVYRKGDRPRYSWIVWNRGNDKAQVYTSGVSVYRQIADLTEEWGDPQEFDITIKRTGSGMNDTEYSVVPVKTSDSLTKEQEKETSNIDLPKAAGGKWLKDYVSDGELPTPRIEGEQDEDTTEEPLPTTDADEEMPADFLD